MAQSNRILSARWLKKVLGPGARVSASELPLYLCPALGHAQRLLSSLPLERGRTITNNHCNHGSVPAGLRALSGQAAAQDSLQTLPTTYQQPEAHQLPQQCAGCGALSQSTDSSLPGYFNLGRKAVRQHLGLINEEKPVRKQDRLAQQALQSVDFDKLASMGIKLGSLAPSSPSPTQSSRRPAKAPLCDRCHELVHHHTGNPIYHPSIQSLRETIEESPHRRNHIYHVLDAADFPMSLVPNINQLLELAPLRTRNRRSRFGKFQKGRKMELSFIITRSDLLAPQKEQVDTLLPQLREILREALGRRSRDVRLGNVRLVSAKRGWWTRQLKEDIWERGGAGWMVGRVNVGKSQLFEAVFPRGRMSWKPEGPEITVAMNVKGTRAKEAEALPGANDHETKTDEPDFDDLDKFSLLPPARAETEFPEMPIVSSLPGTTASPIRVPFGNGKGELIDLPGLSRGDIELFVKEEDRPSLVMKSRVIPEQQTLRPGKSLLLGGLIRITPRTPDLIFLSYAFTPFTPHLTSTEKAIAIHQQIEDAPIVENIALPGIGDKMKHAGSFQLRYDVTKKRAGPLTRKDSVGLKVDRLPFRVLAIDILIEGCGWVEVVAQVRAKQLELAPPQVKSTPKPSNPERLETLDLFAPDLDEPSMKEEKDTTPQEPNWPVIDVYSPEGRFIGSRAPINGWLMNKPRKTLKSRPRKSMKGIKKETKRTRRAGERKPSE